MSGGQFARHQCPRGRLVTVLAESAGQVGGTGYGLAQAAASVGSHTPWRARRVVIEIFRGC